MANAENKFKIILADRQTMRQRFPLSEQQRRVNAENTGLFFVEADYAVTPAMVDRQINKWNKPNILGIMIYGFISEELNKTDEKNTEIFGVPVMRVVTEVGTPDGAGNPINVDPEKEL